MTTGTGNPGTCSAAARVNLTAYAHAHDEATMGRAPRLTPGGWTRADTAPDFCGCGARASVILIIQRVKGRSGARTGRTSRIPLCHRHEQARSNRKQAGHG